MDPSTSLTNSQPLNHKHKKYFIITSKLTKISQKKPHPQPQTLQSILNPPLCSTNLQQTIKLLSIFQNLTPPSQSHLSLSLKIQIYILFQNQSFYIKLNQSDLNNQIKWDHRSLENIENCFANNHKNNKISLQFNTTNNVFKCYTAIQSQVNCMQIKILLFQKKGVNLYCHPFRQMRILLENYQEEKQRILEGLEKQAEKYQKAIQEINTQMKEIGNTYDGQIQQMQDKYIYVINKYKQQIKEKFSQIMYIEIDKEDQEQRSQINGRKIVKKDMQENQPKSGQAQQSFANLFFEKQSQQGSKI